MQLPANTFKQRLLANETQIGLWLGLADPSSAELCATAGFDWLLVDGEHGPNDLRSMLSILQAVAPYPSHPVVRVPHGDPALIKQVLEIGATTILVPMVESALQARALVRAMRYPPDGIRGVGSGLARSSRWSSYPNYLHEANQQVCLLVQVETSTALERAQAIAATEGVDGVFIGPADLSASMGYLGEPNHPTIQNAIETGLKRIASEGKASGVLATDEKLARHYIELGANFVAVGVEATMLARATRALAARFKGNVGTAKLDVQLNPPRFDTNLLSLRVRPSIRMNLETLRAVFSGRLHSDPVDMAPFLTDWRGKWKGQALAVVQPDTTADVAAVMKWCHEHKVPVVPQGGNTGLSGGSTPDDSGRAIVLSLARLTKVRATDVLNNTLTVDAGLTLQQVHDIAQASDRLFPLSLAAQGSCTIGGNLATNAGGVQVLRFGNARELCLGLEVVTVDGEVWDGLRGLRKDNTGYDLRDLFIGSEGTLGIITGATLKLFPRPAAQVAAFAAVISLRDAVRLLQLAQGQLGSSLTAFELIGDSCIRLVEKHVPTSRLPLTERSDWYVLLEVSDSLDEGRVLTAIEKLLQTAIELDIVSDVALSTSLAQFRALWALREDISESQGAEGKTIKHDISLPISRIADFVEATSADINAMFPGQRLVVFGHLGDGNLHFNVSPGEGRTGAAHAPAFAALEAPMNKLVHDAVAARGGSISAEHGLGVLRRDEAARYKSPVEMRLMQSIKTALDPHGLLNPGKLLA